MPPAAAPIPERVPSIVTGRTDSTVATRTVCSRSASPREYTSPDREVAQPAARAASVTRMSSALPCTKSSFPRGLAEGMPEARLDLLQSRRMVLAAAMGDLDRSHHRAELSGA